MQVLGALLVIATTTLTVLSAGHALLNKRHSRASAGWIGLIVLSPIFGATLYILLGINRVQRKAQQLSAKRHRSDLGDPAHPAGGEHEARDLGELEPLKTYLDHTGRPLLRGNQIQALVDGDAYYPALIEAIDGAEQCVALMVYLFDEDVWGRAVADALIRAKSRGVQLRILIDGIGTRYRKPILGYLRSHGVDYALFLWSWKPSEMAFINLRNHRKLTVIDGTLAFTGGMNIREDYVRAGSPAHRGQDLHFSVRGPVVTQLMEQFVDDWAFTTSEVLAGEPWVRPQQTAGPMLARVIPDGPDQHDLGAALQAFMAGLSCAQRRVRIVTPYFLPEEDLLAVIGTAARRGVSVEIYLPFEGNPPYVHWAVVQDMWHVLEHGCRVWRTQNPFDHTKLMVVDDRWVLMGSSNWDPRSLRLNFELLTEVWSEELAHECNRVIDARAEGAVEVLQEHIEARRLPRRLRDGIARLFKPYL